MTTTIRHFVTYINAAMNRDEDGASMVEYGLLVALIAVAVIVTLQLLGGELNSFFGEVNTEIAKARPSASGS